MGGKCGHPGIVPVCPGNCGTRDTQAHSLWGGKLDIPGVSR